MQARTEIDVLNKILENDVNDDKNIVRLLDHFIYRNHQCLVFEILSFNLYELLRNTKLGYISFFSPIINCALTDLFLILLIRFKGVSLNLIKKFSVQLLKALDLLSRPEVNIIHCDLKPENIVSITHKTSYLQL